MKRILIVLPVLLLTVLALRAQGTMFNAQGQLTENGGPAPDGLYEFQFTLQGAATGVSLVAGPTNLLGGVTNGLFAVGLDFGLAPFANGDARWLEIGVRPAGSGGGYTILTPRQRILPTPYAIRAVTAGSLSTGSLLPATQLSGTIADARLSTNVAMLNRSAQTFFGYDTRLGIRNLNDAGGGFVGNTWSSLQLGIHNPTAQDFGVVLPDQYRSFFAMHASGYMGSVTNSFGYPVFRNLLDDPQGSLSIDLPGANAGTLRPGLVFGTGSSGEGISSRRTAGPRQWGMDFYTGHGLRMSIRNDGNVGIGVSDPQTKLDVSGTVRATTFVGGLIIENRTTDPASPATGQIWLRTDLP